MAIVRTWPGGAANVTPAAASIPTAGELNWAALTDFLVALAEGAQATTFQKFAIRKALTTPVTISSATDCVIATDLSAPGAVAVNLPAGNAKQVFFIVDSKGDAATNNVTITPMGSDTIGGLTSLVLNHNRQGVMLAYNSSDTDWKVAFNVVQPGTITSNDISGFIAPSKGGTGVSNNDASTLTFSGANAVTLTTGGVTGLTLPTTGTLATLAGTENLSNKTIASPNITTDAKFTNQASIKLYEQTGSGTNFIALTAPNSVTTDTTLKLPDGAGSNGQVLTTNGTDTLSWTSPLANPMDSAGDMIVGGTAGAATKLDHPGAAGYVVAATGASTTSFTQSPTLVGSTASLTTQAAASADLSSLQGFSTTAANGPNQTFARSKNVTVGSQTIVASGDSLGSITFKGSNGTSFDPAAQVIVEVDGTPGAAADMPGRIRFLTSTDGTATLSEAMRITNAQNVLVGTTTVNSSGAKMQVGGSGITYPSSPTLVSDANTMEGYKEATFAVSISFAGGTTGITYASQAASYTRIGTRVFYSGLCFLSSKGSSTGQMRINLPYPIANQGVTFGNTCLGNPLFMTQTNSTPLNSQYIGNVGDSYVGVEYINGANSAPVSFTNTIAANNTYFIFNMNYETAAAF